MRLKTIAGIAVLGLLVAACAQTIKSDVQTFHRLPPPSGETFRIVAKDEDKQGGLEFERYAGLIRGQLQEYGYEAVAEDPDLLVRVDYRVSDGREKVRSYGAAGYSFYHFHHGFYSHPFYHGYLHDPYYYGPSQRSYTVYTRQLDVDIDDAETGQRLYEGQVMSAGRENNLPAVMPYLVQALFTNFPGESGVTKVVEIELPDDGGKY